MKIKYIPLMSLIFCGNNLLSASWKEFNPLKASYIKELRALTKMEAKIKEIEAVRKQVYDAENKISKDTYTVRKTYEKGINELRKALEDLSKEMIDSSEKKIKELNSRISNRQGDISKLQEALRQESLMVTTARTINQYSLGWFSSATSYLTSTDDVRKKDLETQIDKLNKEIHSYEKQISEEKKVIESIFSSQAYRDTAATITKRLQQAESGLANVLVKANELRKAQVINPYEKKAQELIKELKQLIKDADCSTIKTMDDAKNSSIKACKERRIDSIRKAFPKSEKCKKLTASSTIEEVEACFNDVK